MAQLVCSSRQVPFNSEPGVEAGMAPLFHNLCSPPRTRVSPAGSVAAANSHRPRGNGFT